MRSILALNNFCSRLSFAQSRGCSIGIMCIFGVVNVFGITYSKVDDLKLNYCLDWC